jgi:hypothetical protein
MTEPAMEELLTGNGLALGTDMFDHRPQGLIPFPWMTVAPLRSGRFDLFAVVIVLVLCPRKCINPCQPHSPLVFQLMSRSWSW